MKIGKVIILPWSWKNFIPRLLVLGLIVGWFVWAFIVWQESQRLEARRQAWQQQLQLRQERIRRQAAYERQLLEQERARDGVKNAVDSFRTIGE